MKEYYVQPYKGLHIEVNFLEIFYPQSFAQVALISRKLFSYATCCLYFLFTFSNLQLTSSLFFILVHTKKKDKSRKLARKQLKLVR